MTEWLCILCGIVIGCGITLFFIALSFKVLKKDEYITDDTIIGLRVNCPKCGSQVINSLDIIKAHDGMICLNCRHFIYAHRRVNG